MNTSIIKFVKVTINMNQGRKLPGEMSISHHCLKKTACSAFALLLLAEYRQQLPCTPGKSKENA